MSRRVRRRPSATPAGQAEPGPRRWRLQPLALLPALLAIAGMLLFAYPTVAAWVTQYNQSKIITSYDVAVDTADPAAAVQLSQAHAYNDALSSGAVLEANANIPTGAGSGGDDALDYDSILDANGAGLMARLRIPAINLDLPVYHGTSDETLLTGLGHLEGTSLPVGGAGTRSVITGHRGLADARMFTDLNRVGVGDKFVIEVFGEVLTYQVIDTKVVEPDETEALRAEEGRDLVTLVTCTPLGINTHRILVTGERIYPTPQEDLDAAGQPPTVPAFPWWAVGLAAGFILVGLYVWRSGYPPRKRPARSKSSPESSQVAPEATSPSEAVLSGPNDDFQPPFGKHP
ncbi:sortase A [Actinomyces ruminicola]|uniref:Sortase A n=1 Tax=Actinomyces ruminicola TaxID=332524 RepID=A0A1H0B4C6_9ACTO|nr:class C sortase [Actinomyces ruminicola]SDN40470.1 sortase A [Actinomyces ruminicola]